MTETEFFDFCSELGKVITEYDDPQFNGYNERDYQAALKNYMEINRKKFEKLDELCKKEPDQQKKVLDQIINVMLEIVEREVLKSSKGFQSRAFRLDSCKMTIVRYLTPAVLKMELTISREFVERLHELWLEQYPKQNYQIVGEGEIAAGFDRNVFSRIFGMQKKRSGA